MKEIVCLLLTSAAIAVYSSCPRGWLAVGDDCLMFARGHASWVDAARSCKHYNQSVLVTIDSYDKMAQINTIAKVLASPTIGMNGFWTGGNDFGVEGAWRWEETNALIEGFTNWAPGSPDGNSSENCMVVNFNGNSSDTYWKDTRCDTRHNYICQMRLFNGDATIIGRK
uniref:Lithostathine-1-like n=1 Tax=Crassostrea virginica TaxID=6565 RepID=A0A8B8AII0_CRAVI|nr:lithostathine-1-like [Crassostrea virginica]